MQRGDKALVAEPMSDGLLGCSAEHSWEGATARRASGSIVMIKAVSANALLNPTPVGPQLHSLDPAPHLLDEVLSAIAWITVSLPT
jgi:hypothetical protein